MLEQTASMDAGAILLETMLFRKTHFRQSWVRVFTVPRRTANGGPTHATEALHAAAVPGIRPPASVAAGVPEGALRGLDAAEVARVLERGSPLRPPGRIDV